MSANWHVTLTPAGKPKVADEHGFSVCTLSGRPYKEMVNDAHKIAAAPELLEALKKARKAWLYEANMGDGIMEEHSPVLSEIDAAIAKAEGKQ